MITFEEAIQIAMDFAKDVDAAFPGTVKAVYAIGSLGSDYYRPGQSDIDTALITSLPRQQMPDATAHIEEIAQKYQNQYHVPKGFGAIVFSEEQLYPPYLPEEELVQEILRLKTQARLIYGDYDLSGIPMPDWQAIKDDIMHFQEWIDSQPPFQYSCAAFVNSTLIALKRYLLLKHHIVEFNKFKVIGLYLSHDPIFVNEEIFAFVDDCLHSRPHEWNETIRERYVAWHDELYQVINNAVLYSE